MADGETKGLPYGADYAKTGRSKCKDKECDSEIGAGDIRLSARTKSNFHDGLQDNWFHADCFWKHARRGINEALIRNFEHLRWEDQEKLRARIKRKEGDGDDDSKQSKNAKAGYAPSSRSSCLKCKQKIENNALRVEFRTGFYHPECLSELHLYIKTAEDMDDFDILKPEDQDTLRRLFTGPNENDIKKEDAGREDQMTLQELKEARSDATDEESRKKLESLEQRKEKLKEQTDRIWEVKAVLESAIRGNKDFKGAKGKKDAAEALLKHNGGNAYRKGTVEDFIQLLADIIVFGAFEPCPTCHASNFYYSPDRRVYQCAGKGKDDPCTYFSREVKRKPFHTNKATSKTDLAKYDGKIMIPGGRVYSKTVEDHAEEDKLISTAPTPAKKIDPSRKRKPEPEGLVRENGFAVDAYFKHSDDFHVYVDDNGDPYQYLLHKIDDKTGDKKFYKIQLLERDDGKQWQVFRRYGVVLTDSTKDMINEFDTLEEAIELFEKQFHDKTGNKWEEREEKKSGKELPSKKYALVEWKQSFSGTYGRTSAETRDEDDAAMAAKKAKIEDDDEFDD